MRRIAILVAVLTVLLLGVLGLLVSRALQSVESEQAMRHSVLAERVFDELEEELTSLIDQEEARPFLQYRFFYVPEGQLPGSAPALSRSPLSEVPEEDWLLGWFQVDPGGDISTPLEPRSIELASTIGGWSQDEVTSDRAARLRRAAEALPVRPAAPPTRDLLASRAPATESSGKNELFTATTTTKPPAPPATTAPKQPAPEPTPAPEAADDGYVGLDLGTKRKKASQSSYDSSISSLNKGAESRAGRQQRVTKSRADNLGSFQNPEEYNNAWLQKGNALPEVEFDANSEDAVADVVTETYRDGDGDGAEDEGGSLLGRLFGEGRRSDVANADLERQAMTEGEAGGEDELAVAALDGLQANADASEIAALADEDADELADEDLYAPQPEQRKGIGRRRNPPKKKRTLEAAAPREQAAQPVEEAVAEVATEEALAEEAPANVAPPVEEAEEAERSELIAGVLDNQAETPEEIPVLVPPPAAGPRSELKDAREAQKQDKDGRVTVTAEVDQPATGEVTIRQPAAEPVAKEQSTRQAKQKPAEAPQYATPEVPLPNGAEEVDVEISPLRGHRADSETLLLYRTVRIGETEYVQGLALLLPALAGWLEDRVLAGAEVRPFLDLVWNVGAPEAPGAADFTFAHTFADPFTSLGTTAYLRALPEAGRSGKAWILQLTLMLLVVGALGIVALWRMVSVVVHFAERRNNFVAAVSHELKTPLTAIRMYSEMLRDGYVLNEEKRAEYYDTMAAESERLSRLIQNVLELSKLERSGTAPSSEPVVGQVQPVLEEAIRVLDRHARDKGFTIELDAPDDLPSVKFERDGLLQVLINLVDNAIKFSKDTDNKVVVVQARPDGDGIALAIRDHGPGVPKTQLKRIFQPFFRGERELTRRTKGTGIGLALVKGIVERMGGEVTARNHPSGGFEVQVALAAG